SLQTTRSARCRSVKWRNGLRSALMRFAYTSDALCSPRRCVPKAGSGSTATTTWRVCASSRRCKASASLFSLREIGQLLEVREHHQEACHEVRDLLAAKLKQVRAKIRELTKLESELAGDLRKCNYELEARKTHAPRIW